MFEATYVINLDRSTERWNHIQQVVRTAGMPNLIRFPGVDGEALTDETVASMQQRGILASDLSSFDRGSRAGEIGCALSHALVLDDVIEKRWRSALILEDDIDLAGDPASWRARFEAGYRDLPESWEVWYLYRCFDIEHRVRRISPRTVIPWTPQGGAGYAVTAAGARIFRAAMTPVGNAVDRTCMNVVKTRKINAFAASPLLIDPGTQPSAINRDNPGREWVVDGVNRPPEYWPETHLAHLGEVPPPSPAASRWLSTLRAVGAALGLSTRQA